ncbi:MAG TPA: monovalent cation:proton antiporter-2 (CPA2) family protein [Azospira sp.]|nr:monovalent cation:proton antiporter-2 (CPA2) family protein [Azospira sp.]HNN07889.1 monovalent cation:proton antiporter-2 (CPA2) family protein [Azospira sp.]HNN45130.1 monovalent cation:proton antiporter-2 (CPA2) family protein [Azospira sp.]
MQDINILAVLLLLTFATGAVFLTRRLRLPSLLAYLIIGIALGPHGFKVLAESEEVGAFAEFGVVFLMFSIGLEFSLARLRAMKALVFGFGGAQVLLTACATTLVALYGYGQRWEAGLVVGLAVSMSSTAIVARILSERFELHSRSGRQTMGVLLFQDIAVVPCLILFPALARPQTDLAQSMLIAAAQTVVVLLLLIGLAKRPMKALLDVVAHRHSEELFVLTTLWIVFVLSYATHAAGLSLALGAFIGGMLISETMYRHQVESDIRPFRDILLGLFFVTVGMMLDVMYVLTHLPLLVLAVFLLVAGKGLVVLLVAALSRSRLDVCLRTAAQLAQAGEFGLVLIQLGFTLKLIGQDVFQLTLSAMLISMFVAPFLIEWATRFSGQMVRGDWSHKAKTLHDIAVGAFSMENHVIVCGYGRTGERVAQFLSSEGIPFVALDLNPNRVRRHPPEHGVVVFGNADRSEVLKAAGVARARGVVVTYPDAHSAERVIRLVRQVRENVPIVVRVADDTDVARLKAAGASEVIPEVLEGSLMIAAEALVQFGVPVEKAMASVRAVRAERYSSLRDFYQASLETRPPEK